jgi:hypothetical protein
MTCPECLRAFSLTVGEADFVIHEASCVYCDTTIHYATVQPMNPVVPHRFHAQSSGKPLDRMGGDDGMDMMEMSS